MDGIPSAPSEPEGAKIAPPVLRALYQSTAEGNVCSQNRIVSADALALENGSDRLTFYVENQGVCIWATELLGNDPPVFVRSNEWNAPWRKESDSLSAFLIQMLVLEATFGAPFGASHDGLDARAMAKLAKRVLSLPLAPWISTRTRFFGSEGVIGFAYPEGANFAVWLGAKERERFEPIGELIADWPDVRF